MSSPNQRMFTEFGFMARLTRWAEELILRLRAEGILKAGHMGCYLCILDVETGTELVLCPIGTMDGATAKKSREDSSERANRFWHLYWNDLNRWSLWNLNDAEDQGVAVRSARCIFSVSGFSGPVNEALALALAMEFDELPGSVAYIIGHQNQPFQMMRAVGQI